MHDAIIWPVIALVALTFAVTAATAVRRIAHTTTVPPAAADFADRQAASRYFAPVQLYADNMSNLLETPVLFYAVVPLLLVTGLAGPVQLALAWVYVALRAGHTYLHIVAKAVRPRFLVFVGSIAALSAMWIGLAVRLATG